MGLFCLSHPNYVLSTFKFFIVILWLAFLIRAVVAIIVAFWCYPVVKFTGCCEWIFFVLNVVQVKICCRLARVDFCVMMWAKEMHGATLSLFRGVYSCLSRSPLVLGFRKMYYSH